ncbi:hypothetical protein [Candidatus Thiodubiliella endoseptemdiera]|uniref:hypothetical protein n=1 Tax=Candidatus Thiodubiliella endoseptemdiera TaxID=2738886 RepID=UPI0034DECBCA
MKSVILNLPIFILLNKFKNLAILILVNAVVISIIFNAVSGLYGINSSNLEQKNNRFKDSISNLSSQLNDLKSANTVDKVNLDRQVVIFKTIVSAFSNVKTSAFKEDHKGFIYAISGETSGIVFLAYKINQAIDSLFIKAQVKDLLIKGKTSVLKVRIFGVIK